MKNIMFYITGHGFGHAVPMIEVIKKLKELSTDTSFFISTTVIEQLFKSNIEFGFKYNYRKNDVGAIQKDWFRIKKKETFEEYARFIKDKQNFISSQTEYVKDNNIAIIVSDIPALAFPVAKKSGIPGIAISNFTWDWIYSPFISEYPQYKYLIDGLKESYSQADILLQLPFHGDMSVFPKIEDIPFITRRSSADRDDVLQMLNIDKNEKRKIVLVTFGGIEFSSPFLKELGECKNYLFIWCGNTDGDLPSNIIIYPKISKIQHHDLVKVSDLVISKPGYGIVSECIANRTPMMYTSRDDFIEYEILLEGMNKYMHSYFIPRDDMISGRWENHLDKFFETKFKWPKIGINGAEIAARKILNFLK